MKYLHFAKDYVKKLLELSKNSIDLFIYNEMINFLMNSFCSNFYEYDTYTHHRIIWKFKIKLFLILIEEQPNEKLSEILGIFQKFVCASLELFYKESSDFELVIYERVASKTNSKCYRFNYIVRFQILF